MYDAIVNAQPAAARAAIHQPAISARYSPIIQLKSRAIVCWMSTIHEFSEAEG